MKSPDASNPHDAQAAAWLARRDRGLTASEQDEFFAWLAADPRHGEALAEHQQTVRSLGHLAEWRPEHGSGPNPDLLSQPRRRRQVLPHRFVVGGLLAAAAAIAVVFVSADRGFSPVANSPVKKAPQALVLEKILEDGTTVAFGSGAEIGVNFLPGERRVRLIRGAAHFAVAKNPLRPFIVEAGDAEVRALGTEFDLHVQPNQVEVLVTEGSVAVTGPTAASSRAAVVVAAGHRTRVGRMVDAADFRALPMTAADRTRLVDRKTRLLEFSNAPLSQVVAELNRDSRVTLVVAEPDLAALPIGATLRSDNIDGFVRLLEESFGVDADRSNETKIVLRRKQSRTVSAERK